MSVYYFYDIKDALPFSYLTPTRMAGELPPPYESSMTARGFLEFAIIDYKEGTERGYVNAFGNIKRAMHLAIDTLLNQYGLFTYFKKSNFPTKLQILDSIGILPITIVQNLNVERNLLEHEYIVPNKKRIAEAIDVAKLILLATEKLLESTPYESVVGWRDHKCHLVLQLEPILGRINLFSLRAKGQFKKIKGISCFVGNFRTFGDNTLSPRIKISKKPWKIIELKKETIHEWKPILMELVNIQRKGRTSSHINKESGTIVMPISVPIPTFGVKSFATIMDEFLEAKFKNKEETREKK